MSRSKKKNKAAPAAHEHANRSGEDVAHREDGRSPTDIGHFLATLIANNPNRELTSSAEINPATDEPPERITAAYASSPLPENAVTEASITTADGVPMSIMMALTVMPTAKDAAINAATSARPSPVSLSLTTQ